MSKFREYSTITEVRGVSTVTWVNTSDVCRNKESFQKALDEKGDKAFIYGTPELRKNREMCKYAASKGATIESLYTFGMLDDEIIVESLKATNNKLNDKSFGEQIGYLFDHYTITPELFDRVLDCCEPGTSFGYEIARSSVKNDNIKSLIANNKDIAMKCLQKDPYFYQLLSPALKSDPDIKNTASVKDDNKEVFYGLDGTQFSSMEEAVAYNETLGHEMKLV